MAIQNVLVAYNGGDASEAALRAAINMAKKYDAHLTGLLAYSRQSIARGLPGWLSDSMTKSIVELTDTRAQEVQDSFREAVDSSLGSDKLHWIDTQGDPDQMVIRHSRLFDILVIGQYETLPEINEFRFHPDKIAELSGRPLLLAPSGYRKKSINDCAVVAWDGGAPASKAIMGALEILRTKSKVHVVNVLDGRRVGRAEQEALSHQLERHGIQFDFEEVEIKDKSVSGTILDVCRRVDAGVLVSGAYGHSRVSENFVGGVTRDLIGRADIPVLMAH